jgi:hypothetical protein
MLEILREFSGFVCDAAAQSILAANDITNPSAGGTPLSLKQ